MTVTHPCNNILAKWLLIFPDLPICPLPRKKRNKNKIQVFCTSILPSFTSLYQNLAQSTSLIRKPLAPCVLCWLILFFPLLSNLGCHPKEHRSTRPALSLSRETGILPFPTACLCITVTAWALHSRMQSSAESICCRAPFLAAPELIHSRQGGVLGESLSLYLPWKVKEESKGYFTLKVTNSKLRDLLLLNCFSSFKRAKGTSFP